MSSPGFGVVRRWRSEAWERGESKGTHEIESWGMCSARALARRGRRALPGAVHGGVAVAAAWAALEAAGRVARPGKLQREATGGGGGAERCVGASAKQRRSWSWPGRRRPARRGSVAREAEQAGWGRRQGPKRYFQKFQGHNYKTRITINLGLK